MQMKQKTLNHQCYGSLSQTISKYKRLFVPPPPKKILFQNIWFLDVTNGYQHIFLRDDGNELGKGALYRIDFKSLH